MKAPVKANVSFLTYGDTEETSIQKTVVAAGTRVCLRAYGLLEYPVTGVTPEGTRANFRTTSESDTVVFSDIAPFSGWQVWFSGAGSPFVMVRIPGDGILFKDGLYIELEEIVTRTEAMRTVLQVVYT